MNGLLGLSVRGFASRPREKPRALARGGSLVAQKGDLDSEIIRKVRSFSSVLKKAGIPVKNLIVFGSQVKGFSKPYSDIDVCVVSPQFGKDSLQERVKLNRLAEKVDWRLEPHPYSPKDLAIAEDPFADEIRRTGVELTPS